MGKVLRVGMLGYGTVGRGAFRMLRDNREAITRKIGFPAEIVKIAVRDAGRARDLPQEIFTFDPWEVVHDPGVDVVLELIGGVDPAAELVEGALMSDKHVVTANKELMAREGSRLVHLAKTRKLDLHYEAAVGGGIPLVQPMKHQLAGNDVLKMMGILNGTTNYILTSMQEQGADFAEALLEAQEKGYAESDPTNDVDGHDAAYKITILAGIAFGKQVPIEQVTREGIRSVTKTDMAYADVLGYRIKLLGIVEPVRPDRVRVRVHPTLLPKVHPLASVNGVYNAVYLHGDFVGDLMFSGRGAGSEPTASAVVGDLIDVGRNIAACGSGSAIPYDMGMEQEPMETLKTSYYLRLIVQDRSKVLGAIASEFGDHNVSLAAMEMKTLSPEQGEIVFLTHPCLESDFMASLEKLRSGNVVERVANWFRVER